MGRIRIETAEQAKVIRDFMRRLPEDFDSIGTIIFEGQYAEGM